GPDLRGLAVRRDVGAHLGSADFRGEVRPVHAEGGIVAEGKFEGGGDPGEVGRVPGGNPLAQGVVRQGAVHGARVDVGEAELGGDAPGGARLSGAADAVDGDEGKHGGKINAKCEM